MAIPPGRPEEQRAISGMQMRTFTSSAAMYKYTDG
jgi:hypothetical protein